MFYMKKTSLYLQAVFYTLSGINHFWHPALYEQVMPPWLPYHDYLIAISGIGEIMLGLSLLPRISRSMAAWGIILLLICIFPANIQMTINFLHRHSPYAWLTIVRLPLQALLIWWAYIYTKRRLTTS